VSDFEYFQKTGVPGARFVIFSAQPYDSEQQSNAKTDYELCSDRRLTICDSIQHSTALTFVKYVGNILRNKILHIYTTALQINTYTLSI
jgi:hypothetical protein